MQLRDYLATNFPNLILSPPLFYTWPVAIRFELNGDIQKTPSAGDPYFASVVQRASSIYQEAFRDSESVAVVSVRRRSIDKSPDGLRFRFKHRGKKLPDLFRFSRHENIGLSRPSGKAVLSLRRDRFETEIMTYRWSECSPLKIKFPRIFQAIANQDFPNRHPRLEEDVYFVDTQKHIILNMYDDRGMDVLAAQPGPLQSLYSSCNSWILDYDRLRIDDTFLRDKIWTFPEIYTQTRVKWPEVPS